jgi:hypothetical protein
METVTAEILMLLSLKRAQEHFVEQLCSRANQANTSLRGSKKDARVFVRDHQDKVTRIAEFFFLMSALAPLTAERVETVAREHNVRLQRKIEATEEPWISSKLRRGLFSPNAIRMLGMNNVSGVMSINLSQSDLARFFCDTMSDELTRNLVTVLVDCSILTSVPAWYNAKLICSPGILEDCYRKYLEALLDGARSNASDRTGLPSGNAFEPLSTDPVFSILGPLFISEAPPSEVGQPFVA